ncbi:MAG: hypothetical protein K6T30_07650 [Alicyclobacillus sp.]|nr:hypothetical protein [Alicyclobacillus sp.]
MNLLEAVCAAVLLAACGGASLPAWGEAVRELAWAEQQRIAVDAAELAAERMVAGVSVPQSLVADGRTCEVTIDPHGNIWEIEARCGDAEERLWVPMGLDSGRLSP